MYAYRILRPYDAPDLAKLHAQAFPSPWSAEGLRSELAKPTGFGLGLLLSTQSEEIVSFVLFQRALDDAEILTLATAPACQRMGLARTLLNTGFDHLRESGTARCLLDVAADNLAAIGLYKSLGFTEDTRRKAYYKQATGSGVDAVLMSLGL